MIDKVSTLEREEKVSGTQRGENRRQRITSASQFGKHDNAGNEYEWGNRGVMGCRNAEGQELKEGGKRVFLKKYINNYIAKKNYKRIGLQKIKILDTNTAGGEKNRGGVCGGKKKRTDANQEFPGKQTNQRS